MSEVKETKQLVETVETPSVGRWFLMGLLERENRSYEEKRTKYVDLFKSCEGLTIPPLTPTQVIETKDEVVLDKSLEKKAWVAEVKRYLQQCEESRGKEAKAKVVVELYKYLETTVHQWFYIERFAITVFKKMVEFIEEPWVSEFIVGFIPRLFNKSQVLGRLEAYHKEQIQYLQSNFKYVNLGCVDDQDGIDLLLDRLCYLDRDRLPVILRDMERIRHFSRHGIDPVVIETQQQTLSEIVPKALRTGVEDADVELLVEIKSRYRHRGYGMGFTLAIRAKLPTVAHGVAYLYQGRFNRDSHTVEPIHCVAAMSAEMKGTEMILDFPTIVVWGNLCVRVVWYGVPWEYVYSNRFVAKISRDCYAVSSYELENVLEDHRPASKLFPRFGLLEDLDDLSDDEEGEYDSDEEDMEMNRHYHLPLIELNE
jgi:hypothetical protein